MWKTLMATTTALTLAAATVVSLPSKAEAYPVWVIPAIIGAGIVGVGAGATVANANSAYYGPRGTVYVEPTAAHAQVCHIVRERTADGWRRIQVCD